MDDRVKVLMTTVPKLSHIVERNGLFFLYFERLNMYSLTVNKLGESFIPHLDTRLTWVDWAADVATEWGWSYYCWSTPDPAVAVEYTLRYG